jgi:hypothetical protein
MRWAAKWVAGTVAFLTTVLGLTGVVATATPAGAVTKLSPACATLSDVIRIVTESDAAAERQAPGWVLKQANGWTVFVPNSDWGLSASDAGADMNSPNGKEDASLITWYASLGTRWTMTSLVKKFTGALTRVKGLCQTSLEQGASGESQAFELSGYLQGEQVRAVLIDSILTQTTETSVGESRYAYTPAAQWSVSNAETLALIIKLAIQSPQSLGQVEPNV